KRYPLRRGQVFALYVAMYTFGRVWFEALRIDDASKIFGIRFNLLLSAVLCVLGVVWFIWLGRHSTPSELHERRTVSPAGEPDRQETEHTEDTEQTKETADPAVAQVDDRQT